MSTMFSRVWWEEQAEAAWIALGGAEGKNVN